MSTFCLDDHLRDVEPEQLDIPECRRLLTQFSPILFALLYLPHHLASKETRDQISFSQFHADLCDWAARWARPEHAEAEERAAWVAPRGSGKSTWTFLILPVWSLAHNHRRYIAAYADSGYQAQQHLMSFKLELSTNKLLREDFPDLVAPAMRAGMTVADRQDIYIAASGVVFTAKGIDSSTLGAKVGNQRPDLILFDDVEPDESNYSLYQKDKRLATIRNAVLPMNLNAVVAFVGTTTMQGSIMHDLVRQNTDQSGDIPAWPAEEKIRVNYYHAITTAEDGSERSLWPERWSLEYLDSIRTTISFLMNFANQPVSDGGWWQPGDVRYGKRQHYDRVVMFIDGAVTSKATSDQTGIAILGLSAAERKLFVREAIGIRLTGEPRRARIIDLIIAFDVDYVMAEANQGGDMWHTEFHDLPVKLVTFTQHEPKRVRIKRLLSVYQRADGAIFHEKQLPQLDAQQSGYPKVLHEDILDAVAAAAEHLVGLIFANSAARKSKALVHQFSYRQGR